MNFRFHPETLSRLISSRPGASQVPLFPNGIAKVLLFPEPPNFSALFFIFFRRIRTAGDFPAALTRAQWAGRQRNPGPDGQIRPGGIFFAGRSGHDGGEGLSASNGLLSLPWKAGKMILRTDHLTHFPTNTAAGSAFNVSPGTLFLQYHARWAENDTPDYPPDSIPHKYRGR